MIRLPAFPLQVVTCCIFLAFLVGNPLRAQNASDASRQIPELIERLSEFESEREALMQPFNVRRTDMREKYTKALDQAMASATAAGNLDAALAIKNERAALDGGEDILMNPPDPAGGADLTKLRAIFQREWDKIAEEEGGHLFKARSALAEKLEVLEKDLTRDNRLEDAVAVRAIRTQVEDAAEKLGAVLAPDPAKAVTLAILQKMREDGGRLRISGMIAPSIPAACEGFDDLPTDFVEVHAFRTAWIGIRKNGMSVVMGLNAEKTEQRLEKGWRLDLVARGYDAWCYEGKKIVHRLVNWEIDRPSKLASPVAIAAGHANCVLFNARGGTEYHGGNNAQVITPGKALLESVKTVVSSKNAFLVIDEAKRGQLWNMRSGSVIASPLLDTNFILDSEGGQDHVILLDHHHGVQVIDIDGAPSSVTRVPDDLGDVIRVKAGGEASAVQRTDGTWKAWGESKFVNTETSRVGLATDLDIYYGEGADYVIWIEPKR